MQTGKPLPFISQQSVRQVLDFLIYSSPKPDSPLLHLLLIDEFLLNPDLPAMANPREYALAYILGLMITSEFSRQRQNFGIKMADENDSRENILKLIEEDARIASAEIVGWSWLYHHFVRVDLSISSQEFCGIVHVDERTLRRYQIHISKRLTDLVIDAEWQARTMQRKRRLYSELPISTKTPMMGREALVVGVTHILSELGSAHFQITGGKGVGKTTFVERVLQIQIESENVDQLVWIDRPCSSEYIRHQLLERFLPPQSQIGVREFLQLHRTVIVIDGAELIYQDVEGLHQLLILFSAATMFITCHFDLPIINTVQVTLPELDRATAFNLTRHFLKIANVREQVSDDTANRIQTQIGGNPLALQLTALNWSRINFHSLTSNVGLDTIFTDLFESIELDVKYAWIAFAILGTVPLEYASLHKIWPQYFTSHNVNQLLSYQILHISADRQRYSLIASARNYVRERYITDPDVREIVDRLIENFEDTSVTDTTQIESILMNDWIVIEASKRREWINRWCEMGLSRQSWSIWRLLLDAEMKSEEAEVSLAIGYATCLRHLGESDAARMHLHTLVEAAGRKGAFADQTTAMVELAIVERQSGAYERASSWLSRAEQMSVRFKLDPLYEKIIMEQAQIAVDIRDVETFASLIVQLPDNPKANLLRSEMFLLWNDIESGKRVAETILSSADLPLTTKAHVHNILGRIYERMDELQKAEEHFSWCLMIIEKGNDAFSIARAQANLGSILLRLRCFEEARVLLENAEVRQSLFNDPVGLASTRHNLRLLEIETATS